MNKYICDVKDCGKELSWNVLDGKFNVRGGAPYRGKEVDEPGAPEKASDFEKEFDNLSLDLCHPHAVQVRDFLKGLKG